MRAVNRACGPFLLLLVASCAEGPGDALVPGSHADDLLLLNRVTWGANPSSARELARMGPERYLEAQLRPAQEAALPPEVQAQVDAMTITRRPVEELAKEMESRRKGLDLLRSDEEKKAAQQAYQQELTRLGREAAARMLLRALYSPWQLREQMTWFWMNHFNVFQYKANLRVLVADYEERAIRPHALGRFRDLLGATALHPAMLIYLDNAQNAANRINENYARELMELHTLGVDGGYTQRDVQELARILTGFSVNFDREMPKFIPGRHDYGDKLLLGRTIRGRGAAEVDEALDLLARHPATARFICRKLALFFVSDDPSEVLVERLASTFRSSDGDIAAVLRELFASAEFRASLGAKFKDPVHYVLSAVRLAYDDKAILNAGPMINWLGRMGEPLYARPTPDGFALTRTEWASAGQMATRFEIARTLGYGAAGLFRAEGPQPAERPAFPQLANALYYESMQKTLAGPTRSALDNATSPQEWNMLLLASPEFMNR
ncbi:MAG: DUF1800 domain-containing protein [Betaproteobacteria bacterium]|nr:MAG: DUF1800 domain-containing protein [Betaproteobacteria bacterium]